MTQQACLISELSIEFPQTTLLKPQSFCLFAGQRSALIGRNGQGKSVLLHYLHHQCSKATVQGQCTWQMPHAYLSQFLASSAETVARFLGVDGLYQSFKRIEQGVGTDEDDQAVENQWHLPNQWQTILRQAGLSCGLDDVVTHFSAGQKTKLALCALFLLSDHYLLLDEPTNHLDHEARAWLIHRLHEHRAGCFIVSHDQTLLEQMQHIYDLSGQKIQHYTGNYTVYRQAYLKQHLALERRIDQGKSDLKQLKQQQISTQQKAQKRQSAGKKIRHSASQAKVLLDFKQNKAGQHLNRMATQQSRQLQQQQVQLSEQQAELEHVKAQRFTLWNTQPSSGEILRIKQLQLAFVSVSAISFALEAGEKLILRGKNGVGKSSLLQLIQQNHREEIFRSGQCVYLDQHLNMLDLQQNAITNLMKINPQLSAVEWRKRLGQLRLKGEKALQPMDQLSGGERLKVTLLALSQAQQAPTLLLLDEPDNDLDIESKQLLADAIANFSGSVILVSHDVHFLAQTGIQQHYDLIIESLF